MNNLFCLGCCWRCCHKLTMTYIMKAMDVTASAVAGTMVDSFDVVVTDMNQLTVIDSSLAAYAMATYQDHH